MNRTELNRKLKALDKDFNRKLQEIDRKSDQRERKKIEELYGNAIEKIQKPSISTQNETIPEEKQTIDKDSELYKLWKQWKDYTTYFPNNKNIWVLNFPQWFRDLMESE